MKYIVTGSAGFIGSALAKKLLLLGHSVVGIDCYLPNLYPNDPKYNRTGKLQEFDRFEFIEHDLRHSFPITPLIDCTTVFHLAAMAGLTKSWDQFQTYQDCNLLATNNLLIALSTNPKTKLVYASTSSVYGNINNGDESSKLEPISPYGVTKLASENLIRSYGIQGKINYSILRLFSVFGPDQRSDMAFSSMINSILSDQSIQVFGNGFQTRCNTYITDVIEAFVGVNASKLMNETYNICGNEEVSLLKFIEIASNLLSKNPEIEFSTPRVGDQTFTKGVNKKAQEHFGWKAETSFLDGIKAQISHQSGNLR